MTPPLRRQPPPTTGTAPHAPSGVAHPGETSAVIWRDRGRRGAADGAQQPGTHHPRGDRTGKGAALGRLGCRLPVPRMIGQRRGRYRIGRGGVAAADPIRPGAFNCMYRSHTVAVRGEYRLNTDKIQRSRLVDPAMACPLSNRSIPLHPA